MKLHFLGLVLVAVALLTGCMLDNSRLYDGSIPEMPQRWPDDVATCALETDVVVPLNLAITWTKFPYIPGTIAACGGASPGVGYGYSVGSPTLWGMDSAGRGVHSYSVYYTVYMDKNSVVRPSRMSKCNPSNCIVNLQDTDPNWSYHPPSTPYFTSKIWFFNRPIFDRAETINGLVWRHYMFWSFESLNGDPGAPALTLGSPLNESHELLSLAPSPVVSVPYPDALESVGEVYEHVVDADHTMLVFASYLRPVTQDAHWFATRRAMLRKLVDAVTIRPLTPELWRTLMLQYKAQTRSQGEGWAQAQMRVKAEQVFEAHQNAEPAKGH